MADEIKRAAIWKRVAAAILDFMMLFFIGGFAIASLTGGLTSNGFKLQGAPVAGSARHHRGLFLCLSALCRRHAVGSDFSHPTAATGVTSGGGNARDDRRFRRGWPAEFAPQWVKSALAHVT